MRSAAPVLQRKCACSASAPATVRVGRSDDTYEREADRAADRAVRYARTGSLSTAAPLARVQRRGAEGAPGPGEAPPAVHAVLAADGQPLEPRSRGVMESAFGHDFGRVRIHTDAAAAASARSVAAHAYTVGDHVVFAAGRFAPDSDRGLRLLAHELAHVVQQRNVVQRESITTVDDEDVEKPSSSAEAPVTDDDEPRGGARALELRRFPDDGEELAGAWPEKEVADCIRRAAPDPLECDPARPLQWADFTGAVPRRSPFGAATFSDLRERDVNVATFTCTPDAPGVAGLPNRALQAFFVPARSWVKPASSQAGDPAQNGCAREIARCEGHFDRLTRRGFTSITYSMSTRPDRRCPAGAVPRGDTATTRAECTTVVGADCTDRAVAESARLLEHERGHFNLACAIARKANAIIAAGTSAATLLQPARRVFQRQQTRYDSQTNHGCRPAAQARWEADIAAGLPEVEIPLGRRRRGRRR
jgi:Domain of unknown function (DUF4157)